MTAGPSGMPSSEAPTVAHDASPDEAAVRIARDLVHDLRARLGVRARVERLEPFGDGHSGFTYALDLVRDGTRDRCVLRLSPPGVRISGPADVGRQGRIMAALGAAGVPVPRVIAADSRPAIDNRAFTLMELVSGESWEAATAGSSARDVAAAAVEALHRVRAVDPSRTGIGDEQVTTPAADLARWAALAERGELATGAAKPLVDALAASAPAAPQRPSLVHGDFHYANLLFRDGAVVAIVDWEIATLGASRADLGCLAVAALRWRYAPEPNTHGPRGVSVAELVELDGSDPGRARWFIAASCLKYSAIISYNLRLHRTGKRHDPLYERLQGTMRALLEDGCTVLEQGVEALA